MNPQRIFGLILLVAGVVLLIFGLNASDSPVEAVSEGLTGKYTDKTMWYIVGGLISAVLGGAMLVVGRGRMRSV